MHRLQPVEARVDRIEVRKHLTPQIADFSSNNANFCSNVREHDFAMEPSEDGEKIVSHRIHRNIETIPSEFLHSV
jgi:hypothetical protein